MLCPPSVTIISAYFLLGSTNCSCIGLTVLQYCSTTERRVRPRSSTSLKSLLIKRISASAFAVMTCAFVVAAMCGNIFLRLQINEVNSQINDVKSEINALESKKTSLEVEVERMISYSNLEIEAAEIGMQKMDKNQVKYIRVNDKDTAVTQDSEVATDN